MQPNFIKPKRVVYTAPRYLPSPNDIYVQDRGGNYTPVTRADPQNTNAAKGYFVRTVGGSFLPAQYSPSPVDQEPQVVTPSSAYLPAYNPDPVAEFDPNAPNTYAGGLVGPNGEPLPPGAMFFTKQGDPYFGEQIEEFSGEGLAKAFVGWTMKMNYKLFGPTQAQVPLKEGQIDPGKPTTPGEYGQAVATTASNVVTMASNAIHDVQNTGFVPFNLFSRAITEAVGLVFGTLFIAPQRVLGRAITASTLVRRGLSRDTAYAASLMDGTALVNQGKLNDFVRQFEQEHKNPVLLAHELEDPLTELVYDTVTDPWTYIGIGQFVSGLKNGKYIKDFKPLVTITEDVAAAAKAYDNSVDAGRAVLAAVDIAKAPRVGWLDDLSKSIGARTQVSTAKVNAVTDLMKRVFTSAIMGDPDKNASEVARLAQDLAILSRSTDEGQRLAALSNIMASRARNVLLSPAGLETGEVFADMMFEGATFRPRGAQNITNWADEIAKLPVEQQATAWMEKFAEASESLAELRFPSVLTREKLQADIARLKASGIAEENLPAYLKRFVGDDIPKWMLQAAKTHQKLQRVVGPVNKILGFTFIRANPAVWARNYMMDGFIAFIDQPTTVQFMGSYARNEALIKAWTGGTSRLQSAGFAQVLSAVPGQEQAIPKGPKAWKWLTSRMEAVEANTAARVSIAAIDEAARSGIKGIVRGHAAEIRAAGLDVRQVEKLLYQNKLDWAATVKALGGNDARLRVLSNLSDELHDFAVNYQLMDDLRAAATIQDAEERARAFQAIKDRVEETIQMGLRSHDKAIMSEMVDPAYAADLINSGMSKEEVGIFSARAALNRRTVEMVNEGATDLRRVALTSVQGDPNLSVQIENAWALRRRAMDELQRATYGVTTKLRNSVLNTPQEVRYLAWEEYFLRSDVAKSHSFKYLPAPGTLPDGSPLPASMDAVYVILRDAQVEIDVKFAEQIKKLVPGVDDLMFQDAMKQVDLARQVDVVQSEREAAKLLAAAPEAAGAGKVAEAAGVDSLPDEVRLAMVNAADDLQPTVGQAYANAADDIRKNLDAIFQQVESDLASGTGRITPEQQALLEAITPDIERQAVQVRAVASEFADSMRTFTLHDYGDKRGFDGALAYIFPYQYWYSRTYYKWIQRLATQPWIGAAYMRYKDTLAHLHAGLPEWWKYTLNTNEVFGFKSDNPLYFNLEQNLFPLYGLTGVDFNDPDRKHGWFASMLDGIGKFGPSVWAPFAWATAAVYGLAGDTDAAKAWAGRLIPQTNTIKAITGLAGIQGTGRMVTPTGLELDPLMWLQGGTSKYEDRAIGRMLGRMEQEGVPAAQIRDAAYTRSGPIWEMAAQRVVQERAPGQIAGQFAGWSARPRSAEDAAVDQFYQEMFALMARKDRLTPVEYSQAWQVLRERFPFAETILLSRKSGVERDEALSWGVINRIPPGQTRDYAEMVGMDERLLDRFYESKGDISGWEETDKQRFLAGIGDLGAVLDIPPRATSHEWAMAKGQYSAMQTEAKGLFGENVLDVVDGYYALKDDRDASNQYLNANPIVGQYLDWKSQRILDDPLLSKYYGGLDFLESFLSSQLYTRAEAKFGEDIWNTQSIYYEIKDKGGAYSKYKEDHPELQEFWNFLDEGKQEIAKHITEFGDTLPEVPQAFVRSDAARNTIGAIDVLNGIQDIQPADVRRTSEVLAYTSMPNETKWSLTGYIEAQAEGRWPGVVKKNDQYEEILASSPAQAATYLSSNPDVAMFREWERAYRANYNRMAKYGPEANRLEPEQLQISLPPAAQRLLDDVRAGEELPESMEEYLSLLGIGQ